jgi:hypothetical protein
VHALAAEGLGIRSVKTFFTMLTASAGIASFPSIPKAQEGLIIPDEPGKAEPKVGNPQHGLGCRVGALCNAPPDRKKSPGAGTL